MSMRRWATQRAIACTAAREGRHCRRHTGNRAGGAPGLLLLQG